MPAFCSRYPSISPWNLRELTVGDYLLMKEALRQADANASNDNPRGGGNPWQDATQRR